MLGFLSAEGREADALDDRLGGGFLASPSVSCKALGRRQRRQRHAVALVVRLETTGLLACQMHIHIACQIVMPLSALSCQILAATYEGTTYIIPASTQYHIGEKCLSSAEDRYCVHALCKLLS